MGKLPGLVNYSDDEDQSSSSSDEDNQQQQQQNQQPQPQYQQSVTQSKPQQRSTPISQSEQQQQQQTKTQDSNGINSHVKSSSPATPIQQAKLPSSVPTAIIGDRSTQLKTILTPKPLPGVENWGIPSEPQSECDPDRLEKIKHFLSLRQSGHRLNDHLQRNKAFRNPRIYAKLVEFVDLNETGSNFPTTDFDPASFPASSYIDGILETQKKLANEKAQQQAQGRSQLSFVSSSNKPAAPSSLDTNAKLAAAMANAAKIANRIAKPIPQQQQQQQPPPPPASSSHDDDHYHSDHRSSQKRSSHHHHRDRRDEKRRHRY